MIQKSLPFRVRESVEVNVFDALSINRSGDCIRYFGQLFFFSVFRKSNNLAHSAHLKVDWRQFESLQSS